MEREEFAQNLGSVDAFEAYLNTLPSEPAEADGKTYEARGYGMVSGGEKQELLTFLERVTLASYIWVRGLFS